MLFTSLQWVLFLGAAFTAHHLVSARMRPWVMLASSIAFYATWSVPYLALIFGQLVVDWTCGHFLSKFERDGARRAIVAVSVVVNLGTLCGFKYWPLIAETLGFVHIQVPRGSLLLPLAISFYTFESMSYTIDVYRRRIEPVRSPIHLALFVTWFPHLIAGPIIRPSELIPQFAAVPRVTRERFFSGASLMAIGYAKKLLGADWLGEIADTVFANPTHFSSLEVLLGVYAYAFQIYFDFSAYTDIARGASRWFGIELPENFDAPYSATSITDFWRRWHMTLSHWLRDYLYVPLGGNRSGAARTYVNLMITMLLGGLWHGASWTFLAWGGLHGLYLVVERRFPAVFRAREGKSRHEDWARRIVTFHLVCVAWVLFRAPTFRLALDVFRTIGRGELGVARANLLSAVGTCAIIATYYAVRSRRARAVSFDPGPRFSRQLAFALVLGALLSVLLVLGASSNDFIYFQF